MTRVVITGMGVRSAIGNTLDEFWDSAINGRANLQTFTGAPDQGVLPYVGASVNHDPAELGSKLIANQTDRTTQIALLAVRDALAQSGHSHSKIDSDRYGVYWGSGAGGIGTTEAGYKEFFQSSNPRIHPLTVVMGMPNAAAGQISILHGLRGPMLAFSNACSSASQAIGEALLALRSGRVDCIIAGGADAVLQPGVARIWQGLGVLAKPLENPHQSSRPFCVNRSGLVLAEGAAAFVLETEAHALARGVTPICELAGYGISSDAAHLSKPSAEGQFKSISAALKDAHLNPSEIGYVNAHGTGTPSGDPVEIESLAQVFGAVGPWISSTKALHGHSMGAAGAVELIAAVESLRRRQIIPQWNCSEALAGGNIAMPNLYPSWPDQARVALSNSFAFGGCNVTLAVKI